MEIKSSNIQDVLNMVQIEILKSSHCILAVKTMTENNDLPQDLYPYSNNLVSLYNMAVQLEEFCIEALKEEEL